MFHARADARYCTNACRQKAHRTRAVRRAAEESLAPPELADAITRARHTRDVARTIRERAEAARRDALHRRRETGRPGS